MFNILDEYHEQLSYTLKKNLFYGDLNIHKLIILTTTFFFLESHLQ